MVLTSLDKLKDQIVALCKRFDVVRLEVFGSATSDAFDARRSDFDFLVDWKPGGALRPFDRYFGLKESLEDLLGRAVDLVEVDGLRNPYFIRQVNASRRTVYAA